MSLTLHGDRVSTATVRTMRTVNSVYVLISYPGKDLAELTCVTGTFGGQRWLVRQSAGTVPHVGDRWLAMLEVAPWVRDDRILTSEILEISTL